MYSQPSGLKCFYTAGRDFLFYRFLHVLIRFFHHKFPLGGSGHGQRANIGNTISMILHHWPAAHGSYPRLLLVFAALGGSVI